MERQRRLATRLIPAALLLLLGAGCTNSNPGFAIIPSGTIQRVTDSSVWIDGEEYHTNTPDRYMGAEGLQMTNIQIKGGVLVSGTIVAPEGSWVWKTSTTTCLMRPPHGVVNEDSIIRCTGN